VFITHAGKWVRSTIKRPLCGSVGTECIDDALRSVSADCAVYDLLDLPFEHGRYRAIRPLLFEGLSGVILDAGVGTGRNFPFYPHHPRVTGVDISPAMLARAARRLPVPRVGVELRQMDVTRLDFPDRHFDAVVATFLFCVLPETLQVPALLEIGRVVNPGGAVRGRSAVCVEP
jgi:ubiquinone/menaquinone biosynthesis C-methylase UbiE